MCNTAWKYLKLFCQSVYVIPNPIVALGDMDIMYYYYSLYSTPRLQSGRETASLVMDQNEKCVSAGRFKTKHFGLKLFFWLLSIYVGCHSYYLAISLELLLDPCCWDSSPQFQRSELSLQESKKWECCSLCGVGFTSLKQAEQHYNGKNHAKKLRLTEANACLEKAAEANIVKK